MSEKGTFTKHNCKICKTHKLVYVAIVPGKLKQFKCSNCKTLHFITKDDILSHYQDSNGTNIRELPNNSV